MWGMSDAPEKLETAWADEQDVLAAVDELMGTASYDPATRPPETVAEAFKANAYGEAMSLAFLRSFRWR